MSEFYVTFGQQYRYESHPNWEPAHPDGWLTIVAPGRAAARTAVFALCGPHWSFMYADTEPDAPPRYEHPWGGHAYPLGELGRIEVSS